MAQGEKRSRAWREEEMACTGRNKKGEEGQAARRRSGAMAVLCVAREQVVDGWKWMVTLG